MKNLAAPILALAFGLGACSEAPTAALLESRAPSLAVSPGANTEIVTEDDVSRQPENSDPLGRWVIFTRNAGAAAFAAGPGTPPSGVGSLQLSTPSGSDKVFIYNFDHVGLPLADINALSYSTYRSVGGGVAVPAINIVIDFNGPNVTGGFTTLVYEPYVNPDQGAVATGVWQTWDAFNGGAARWWSSKTIPGDAPQWAPKSWATIVAANPDAVILGGFGINQGSGNPGVIASADAVTLGVTGGSFTYDFEQFEVVSDKDQCKNDGWKSVKAADGSSFRNQGQCVAYVTV